MNKLKKPLNGKVIDRYDNGKIRHSGSFKNGKMHGSWKFYRKDGSLMRTGSFREGERVGIWKTFLRTGELAKETDFNKF